MDDYCPLCDHDLSHSACACDPAAQAEACEPMPEDEVSLEDMFGPDCE
jgi:hypothetical protein